jgi:hypothetical protein
MSVLRTLLAGRRAPGLARDLLRHSVCPACALVCPPDREGARRCPTRLEHVAAWTRKPLDPDRLPPQERLSKMSSSELRALGRLATPLLHRGGDSGLRPIPWDDALRLLGRRLVDGAAIELGGPVTVEDTLALTGLAQARGLDRRVDVDPAQAAVRGPRACFEDAAGASLIGPIAAPLLVDGDGPPLRLGAAGDPREPVLPLPLGTLGAALLAGWRAGQGGDVVWQVGATEPRVRLQRASFRAHSITFLDQAAVLGGGEALILPARLPHESPGGAVLLGAEGMARFTPEVRGHELGEARCTWAVAGALLEHDEVDAHTLRARLATGPWSWLAHVHEQPHAVEPWPPGEGAATAP